jgi:thiamine biosynthesis lipoprotein
MSAAAALVAALVFTQAPDPVAPAQYRVRLETTKGPIVIEVRREWAPHGADRFHTLVRSGYYDDTRFFRVVKRRWAQFGINGDPGLARAWRYRTIPDDPKGQSNRRGTVSFAFAVPGGRATQVYIALADLSDPQDAQGFVPFGRVVEGMDVADALNSEYGERSGGGIRAGRQQPLFDGGNAWLDREFPRLDRIVRATVLASAQEDGERFEFTSPHMGTLARLVIHAPSRSAAERGARAAFERIAELESRLSDYRADSEVSQLARGAGGPARGVSPDLLAVLLRSQELARRSDGAFDVTVGPLSLLWRAARRRGELPSQSDLEAARARVGHESLLVDASARSCRLERPGMRLDLGGIAKGHAADEALAVLRKRGLPIALVTLGGDVVAGEAPPGKAGWSVAIRTPGLEPAPIVLRDAAVSTSGDAEQWLEAEGVRYSHVLDPRTGRALAGRRSVTVVARQGSEADALATALSVLGAERGLALVESSPGTAALMVVAREGGAGFDVTESSRWAQLHRAGGGGER